MESSITSTISYVEKALQGDYSGMNFGVLVRLSFEPKKERDGYRAIPTSGIEINNRLEQIRLATEKIEARGGTVTYLYDEPDTSAWKQKPILQPDGTKKWMVDRPVFEGAMRDLKRGTDPNGRPIHALAVVFDHRLTRDLRHLQDAKEVVAHHDRPIIDLSGILNLLTEEGRNNADYQVKANETYSRTVSTQMKLSHAARARTGIPVGGQRPFGFEMDKRTHKKDEADLIRDTVKWLLDNKLQMHTVEQRWYDAGFRTSKGGRIPKKTIKNILMNPRIAGIRTYKQKGRKLWEAYLLDANGQPVKGQWVAIIEWDRWQQLVYLLTNEDRPFAGQYLGQIKYLYSPILRCGECGGRISGQAKGGEAFDYACKNPGCGKVAGSGRVIDALLTPVVIGILSQRSVTVKVEPWPKAAELQELEEEKAALLQQTKDFPKQAGYIWPQIGEKDE